MCISAPVCMAYLCVCASVQCMRACMCFCSDARASCRPLGLGLPPELSFSASCQPSCPASSGVRLLRVASSPLFLLCVPSLDGLSPVVLMTTTLLKHSGPFFWASRSSRAVVSAPVGQECLEASSVPLCGLLPKCWPPGKSCAGFQFPLVCALHFSLVGRAVSSVSSLFFKAPVPLSRLGPLAERTPVPWLQGLCLVQWLVSFLK